MGSIQKIGVIGAGVMGSGIAAHLANAGADVLLLDIDTERAASGVTRQLKAGGFMDPAFASRIRAGSINDNLNLLVDADWIIEAVAENLTVKQSLYAAIEAVRKPDNIISSNTSTIPLKDLIKDRSASFAGNFLITHFFNPPRQMRLMEFIVGPMTSGGVVNSLQTFIDRCLGKNIVFCKDTPGFIANRIGCFWMAAAQAEAIALKLDVEEADAIISKPFGIPGTGVFGLFDLIGIDLMQAIIRGLQQALPPNDAFQQYASEPPLITRMIAEGRTGRKSGGGFIRLSTDRKTREVINLSTGEYRPYKDTLSKIAETNDLRAVVSDSDPYGRFATIVMYKTLAYAASLVPEIADSPSSIDEAMRLGYGWKTGPFELIDKLGAKWFADQLALNKIPVSELLVDAAANGGFYKINNGITTCRTLGADTPILPPEGTLLLSNMSLARKPVAEFGVANLWDLGDGVACLEFITKMHTFNFELLAAIASSLERSKESFSGLVIGSDASLFSAGANLNELIATDDLGDRPRVKDFLETGQHIFRMIKFSPFPVVGAANGLALGGGCEILLHCDAIQAHAELTIGLVETRIGVIPGWGGCKEMLLRWSNGSQRSRGPIAPALAAFDVIAPAKMSRSAFEARSLGFLRDTDGITMNRDRLLADAKSKVIELSVSYTPPTVSMLSLAGPSGASAIRNILDSEQNLGRLSPHDRVVGNALINVLTGGPSADQSVLISEDAISDLERDAFLELMATVSTQERIRHMLLTGKPLRN